MFRVDVLEVVREQLHADAVAAVIVVRADDAQVVVRLVVGMRVLEPAEHLEHRGRVIAEHPAQQRPDLGNFVGAELLGARWRPHRDRLALLGHPQPIVAQPGGHEQPPPGPELLGAPLGVRKSPAPDRVVVKGDG